jgi:hypothetical protein
MLEKDAELKVRYAIPVVGPSRGRKPSASGQGRLSRVSEHAELSVRYAMPGAATRPGTPSLPHQQRQFINRRGAARRRP